jgi:hypothetical protein
MFRKFDALLHTDARFPRKNCHLILIWFLLFFFQLKSLFEICSFVSERNIKYQYLILASLILVACYRNNVSRFSTIRLWLINRNMRVISSVFLILGLFVYFLYNFVFDPRVGRYEKSKMFFFINIIHGIILLFNTTEIKYTFVNMVLT